MKENFLKIAASELKVIRIEHNDSQEELSKKCNVASSTISKYENAEKSMNITKIEQILRPYNVSLAIFFNRVIAKTQQNIDLLDN